MANQFDTPKPIAGQRFGRLIIKERFIYENKKKSKYICICDCGKTKIVYLGCLRSGTTQSCGCLQKERAAETQYKHGKAESREYSIWLNMKNRCLNTKYYLFRDYGGRGISICERWRKSFINFLADIGPQLSKHHTIERINNNGNYEPSNVRWATMTEQAQNKRNNRTLTYENKTLTIAEWARRMGVLPGTLYRRAYSGWSDEKILTTPVRLPKNLADIDSFPN